MMSSSTHAIDPEMALAYMFAGRAKVTLVSKITGKHFTYQVQGKQDSKDESKTVYFVRYLNGPDNQNDFAYLGMVPEGKEKIILTKASKAGPSAPVYRALEFALRNPTASTLEVHHSGTCGRCGRELTDPVSIQTGIGPICRDRMGF
jgi:hypothetical protein